MLPAFGWFALTLVLGLLTVVAFSMLVYISAFYTLSSQGIRLVVSAVGDLLMGGLIPLPFMPEGVQKVLELTPFAAMQNLPAAGVYRPAGGGRAALGGGAAGVLAGGADSAGAAVDEAGAEACRDSGGVKL